MVYSLWPGPTFTTDLLPERQAQPRKLQSSIRKLRKLASVSIGMLHPRDRPD